MSRIPSYAMTLLLVSFLSQVAPVFAQTSASRAGAQRDLGGPLRDNRAPVITTDSDGVVEVDRSLSQPLRVSVVDPDGDDVTLRLLHHPPGLVFAPQSGTGRIEVDIPLEHVDASSVGPGEDRTKLIFEAHDSFQPQRRVRHVVELRVQRVLTSIDMRIGDVTGDGIDDVVMDSRRYDSSGLGYGGAILIWPGPADPTGEPTVRLTADAPSDYASIASELELADVTGDGVLDIATRATRIPTDQYDILVWAGGPGITELTVSDCHSYSAVASRSQRSCGAAVFSRLSRP